MGGKSKPDNSAVVQEQQAQAAQDAAKEAARQQRIQQGLASIKAAFHGSPVMASKTTPYDWSSFNSGNGRVAATGVPAGYTAALIPGATTASPAAGGTAAAGGVVSPRLVGKAAADTPLTDRLAAVAADPSQQYTPSDAAPGGGGSGQYATHGLTGDRPSYGPTIANSAPTATAGTWGLRDASGKVYRPGDKLDITSQYDTGQTSGGFDDAFYNKYKQAVLDYYSPQVDKQYSDAKKQAIYGLGRSGNLISSAANDLTADLKGQYDINTAGVRNQADTAAGDLRSQVNTEEQKATSQLYATEDPEVAAQQSLAAVRDISLQQPQMSPLSALFNVATIGGANVLKGYRGQQNLNTFNASLPTASRSSKIVPTG